MTTATPATLVAAGNVENASTLKYTSPSNGRGTWIDKATFLNYAGSTQTFSVWIVPSGGSAGNSNLVISGRSLAASGGSDFAPELVGKFLAPGDAIYWQASAATSINGAINGRELTS